MIPVTDIDRTGTPRVARPDHLRISIITPTLNQSPYLEDTLRSVLNQDLDHLEYIVIDGGSTDGTLAILEKYSSQLTHWTSEPDAGQAAAINKGLQHATGDIVAYLNSDDLYLPGALATVLDYFRDHPTCIWLSADILCFGSGRTTVVKRARPPRTTADLLAKFCALPQPGMFWRRALLAEGFDASLRYCFDWELALRLYLQGFRCRALHVPVAAFRLHPRSKTVAERAQFREEVERVAHHYETKVSPGARRLSEASRHLRRAYDLAHSGDSAGAVSSVARAAITRPTLLARRHLWGTLRRALGGLPQNER